MALLFNLGARRGWLVNVKPRPHYPRELPDTHRPGGWLGPTAGVWKGAENFAPAGIRSPKRPSRNKSPYRLSYPFPLANNQDNKIFRRLTSSVRNVSKTYIATL
jgi:hypothetical protein